MNGRAAKRIRRAAYICNRPVKELKKEYKLMPYHRRIIPVIGVISMSHKARATLWFNQLEVDNYWRT